MPHGSRDQYSDAPTWTVHAPGGKTGKQIFGNTSVGIFGVSAAEQAAHAGGPASPGWVKRTVGTGGRSGRVQYETIVASRTIATDATDFANTSSANVANTSGTADDAIFAGN